MEGRMKQSSGMFVEGNRGESWVAVASVYVPQCSYLYVCVCLFFLSLSNELFFIFFRHCIRYGSVKRHTLV